MEKRLENANNTEVQQGECEKVEHERRGDSRKLRLEQKNEDGCDEPGDAVATDLEDEQWETRHDLITVPAIHQV